MGRKGQTFSFDIMIASGVFMLAIIFLVYLLSQSDDTGSLEDLVAVGESISGQLVSSSDGRLALVVRNQLQKEKLQILASMDYNELRNLLGISEDFCLHFEDEQGNLIDIDDSPTSTQYSIGSPVINFTVREQNLTTGQFFEYSMQCNS